MSFGFCHIDGGSSDNPSLDDLGKLYDELAIADEEHFDVSVIHDESGYSITAYPSGYVILENLIELTPGFRHIDGVTKEQVIDMWRRLAAGDIPWILALPWVPGLPQR